MSGVVGVVPVGHALSWTPLRGLPLFVHAARAVDQLAEVTPYVGVPAAVVADVQAALSHADLEHLRVVGCGPTLGEALVSVLAPTGAPGIVLLHDPQCPLVPAATLRMVLAAAQQAPGEVLVATRPMTDTVKSVVDGVVHGTVDRDALLVLSSPVVVPAARLHALGAELAGCADLEGLVVVLHASGCPVRWMPVPGSGRRVGSAADVGLLEGYADVPAPLGT